MSTCTKILVVINFASPATKSNKIDRISVMNGDVLLEIAYNKASQFMLSLKFSLIRRWNTFRGC